MPGIPMTARAGAAGASRCARSRWRLLEYIVVGGIIFFMAVMGFFVYSNIRNNAYEARAEQNHDYARDIIEEYWLITGSKGKGYSSLTISFLSQSEPTKRWLETDSESLKGMDFADLPPDYFASILIIKGRDMAADEVGVATIAETGTIYFTRFERADIVEDYQLAFTDYRARDEGGLQASAKGATERE